jgi:hypothetical protein
MGLTGPQGIKGDAGGWNSIQTIKALSTTAYTLSLSDAGALLTFSNAAPVIVTIPLSTIANFGIGQRIDLVTLGTGGVSLVASFGVIIRSTLGLKLRAQYSFATLIKLGANTWHLLGDIST